MEEKRLHQRIDFDEYSIKTNPEAASAGDIMGVAGYDMYQFQLLLKELSMPDPSFRLERV